MRVVEWRESKKGNQWAKINGKICTVFLTEDEDYKGICVSDGGDKKYTDAYDDEDECKDALEELAGGDYD